MTDHHGSVRILDRLGSPYTLGRVVGWIGVLTALGVVVPALSGRLGLVTDLLPDHPSGVATTAALAAGSVLIALGGGLRRGRHRAWLLSTALCVAATAAHLGQGHAVEAALAAAVGGLLVIRRRRFVARPPAGSLRLLVVVASLGLSATTLLGLGWLTVDRAGQAPGTTVGARALQALVGQLGLLGPVDFVRADAATRASVSLGALGSVLALLLLLLALRPATGAGRPEAATRDAVDGLLVRWGGVDSLSWFARRDDRAAIFSPSGKAAVSYRTIGGVSLAAGDPLGDPEAWPGAIAAWLEEARDQGRVPGVLGAGERGARAYGRAGLAALEVGDEAVLSPRDFTTEGRRMRGVRQAAARCRRAGLRTTCLRVQDLDEPTRAEIAASAEAWRDGEVERGFSMSLGRLADPRDGRALLVLCHDADGALRGVLQLVPWGPDGLSLDVARRDPGAGNGLTELMVTDLMARAAALGVERVSWNFVILRGVLARGERLGAGPVARLSRSLLLQASRFLQIESLHRANAKFEPRWTPRFVCFPAAADLPFIGVAALRAESYIVAPSWWRSRTGRGREITEAASAGRADSGPTGMVPVRSR